MNTNAKQTEPRSRELEVALVKIARAFFDYTASQENFTELARLDPVADNFEMLVNNYHNSTGGLHPDLGYELGEWATFKRELLSPDHNQRKAEGKSGIDRRFVDNYGKTPENIIKALELELGITS